MPGEDRLAPENISKSRRKRRKGAGCLQRIVHTMQLNCVKECMLRHAYAGWQWNCRSQKRMDGTFCWGRKEVRDYGPRGQDVFFKRLTSPEGRTRGFRLWAVAFAEFCCACWLALASPPAVFPREEDWFVSGLAAVLPLRDPPDSLVWEISGIVESAAAACEFPSICNVGLRSG